MSRSARAVAPPGNALTPENLSAQAARLGLTFHDLTLFRRAILHRSYLNEQPQPGLEDNERLEFLGDAVVDFLAAEWLFHRLPDLDEGSLTRLRSGMVKNDALARYATTLGLGQMLILGRGEEESGGRTRRRNLSGALEAIIGALYLDQGIEAARNFIRPWFEPTLDGLLRDESDKDAKSRLQEWSQSALNIVPTYREVSMIGPEHAPHFTIEVRIGETVYGTGSGPSKQAAAQNAARAALASLKERGLLTT